MLRHLRALLGLHTSREVTDMLDQMREIDDQNRAHLISAARELARMDAARALLYAAALTGDQDHPAQTDIVADAHEWLSLVQECTARDVLADSEDWLYAATQPHTDDPRAAAAFDYLLRAIDDLDHDDTLAVAP